MTVRITKSLLKFSMLSLSTVATVYASSIMTQDKDLTPVNYNHMSTIQLQQEVEKRSIDGTLPFPMGLALIKRWSDIQ